MMATNKMKRFGSKKSHSWWWASHISPKNYRWLDENLQEMDKQVKEMLTLIEEEGDSFAKKAEMYYERRPQLVTHVENFYRMYRALAERYDQVTGELRKNIPVQLQSQHDSPDKSDSPHGSDSASPEKTPHQRKSSRASGFDFFVGSDVSKKGSSDGSESESESESDSGSDSDKNENGMSIGFELNERILELEKELKEAQDKIKLLEEENIKHGNEDCNCNKSEPLEAELLANRHEMECLRGAVEVANKKFEAELSSRNSEIVKLREDFESASRGFLEEKSSLEAKILGMQGSAEELRVEIERIRQEKIVLESRVLEFEQVISDLKASARISDENFSKEKCNFDSKLMELATVNANLEAKIKQLELHANVTENQVSQLNETVATLNKELDVCANEALTLNAQLDMRANEILTLNSQLDMRADEILALNSQLELHAAEKKFLEEKVKNMEVHLHELHLEHMKLITEIEAVKGEAGNFKERVKELEKEVEMQNMVISENAEGKREAIRQLCMSVEYYRDGYCQLRELIKEHKRHFVMVN
ncbi:Kinase interacting (KIP1-like) family protein [Rhynchospora pubera]|uniref:Kinase interacting (KIP1-like) family protein n=1 Tax=Rhynchospora pubera TaxID=906938 RepID=A0AAV8EMD5_9POAL|nr:Kinase interacting (KIP1-like) family protein [Rhynchospora pubera]